MTIVSEMTTLSQIQTNLKFYSVLSSVNTISPTDVTTIIFIQQTIKIKCFGKKTVLVY